MLASQLAQRTIPSRATRCQPARLLALRSATTPASSVPTEQEATSQGPNLSLALVGAVVPLLTDAHLALAKDGEYGLLEGRSFALLHPIVMGSLFAATVYAGYLGYQWRRLREVGDEIKTMKKALPKAEDGTTLASSELTAKEEERKTLAAGNFRDKHWWWGSLLLASGTGIAIEGCVNTYMRTGRLFPGPHLYAGAAIVGLWAMAASLVPAMQKGDNNARQAHIALNVANVALFAWQLPTGWEIVEKVFQFTSWP